MIKCYCATVANRRHDGFRQFADRQVFTPTNIDDGCIVILQKIQYGVGQIIDVKELTARSPGPSNSYTLIAPALGFVNFF